jgi:hypothetical protein
MSQKVWKLPALLFHKSAEKKAVQSRTRNSTDIWFLEIPSNGTKKVFEKHYTTLQP